MNLIQYTAVGIFHRYTPPTVKDIPSIMALPRNIRPMNSRMVVNSKIQLLMVGYEC